MKKHTQSHIAAIVFGLALLSTPASAQVPNLINYQARIAVGTTNFNGSGTFKFALVNATGNTAYWSNDGSLPLTAGAITLASQPTAAVSLIVTKGLSSVLLGDTSPPLSMSPIPASAFTNADVRLRVWFNDGINNFQLLTPDQRLAPAGYLSDNSVTASKIANGSVLSAKIAAGAVGPSQLASNAVNAVNIATGQTVKSLNGLTDALILAAGANVTLASLPGTPNTIQISSSGGATSGWALGGNGGTTISNFLGTTDNRALELRVNNQRVLRLEPNGTGSFPGPSVIGGFSGNSVTSGQSGNTISGGGSSGYPNGSLGSYGTIGGGLGNLIEAGNYESVVAGGNQNTVRATAFRSVIGGGILNNITGNTATVGGGERNTAGASYSTVPGGKENSAQGIGSFAAGSRARALHDGSFVWADSSGLIGPAGLSSTSPNQFCIRAVGGIQCSPVTNIYFGSQTRQMLNLWGDENSGIANTGTQYGIGVQDYTLYSRTDGGFAWYQGGAHAPTGAGYRVLVAGTTLMTLEGMTPANGLLPGSYGLLTVGALKINGADVAEPFEITTKNLPKGSVVVIDEENPGQLKLSDIPYDIRVAGILSGANGVRPGIFLSQQGFNEGGENVALSGRVYVKADASNGAIKAGDLLTTSDMPGHAMKATDHDRAQGAIIGKAMGSLDEGTGMVLVLVTLQ